MSANPMGFRKVDEFLFACEEVEEPLALRSEVAFAVRDEGWTLDFARHCLDGVGGLQAKKISHGLRAQCRHAGPLPLALLRRK